MDIEQLSKLAGELEDGEILNECIEALKCLREKGEITLEEYDKICENYRKKLSGLRQNPPERPKPRRGGILPPMHLYVEILIDTVKSVVQDHERLERIIEAIKKIR